MSESLGHSTATGQQSGASGPGSQASPYGRGPGPRRSGHNSAAPTLEPQWRSPAAQRHPLIRELVGAAVGYYQARHSSIPELLRRRIGGRRRKKLGIAAKFDFVQRKRSDRTEAVIRCLVFFFSRVHLPTLQVGRYQDGQLVGFFDLVELGRATGLNRHRLDRAISDLVAAEFIYRHQPRTYDATKEPGDRYRGEVSLLKLTLKCFQAFGCSAERLDVFRGRAEDEDHKRRRKEERRRPVSPVGTLVKGLVGAMLEPAIHDQRPALARVADADRATFSRFCWEIGRANPDLTTAEVDAAALRKLYPNGPPPQQR